MNIMIYYALAVVLVAIVSYLLGGINASILVTKIFDKKGEDIRSVGSGNAGFTNVLRTKGKNLALITFVIDFLKGVFAVWVSKGIFSFFLGESCFNSKLVLVEYVACAFCALGHMYPCFFGFKGGKAILTIWSSMMLVNLKVFFVLIVVFLIVFFLTRIISLASIVAAISYPVSTFIVMCFFDSNVGDGIWSVIISVLFSFCISCLVIYRHRGNIRRILSGNEKPIKICK